jgi:hypothetical protein
VSGAAWNTEYGTAWRPEGAEVVTFFQRAASLDGRAIVRVYARHGSTTIDSHPGIEIVVSPKGRSIRVWDRKTGKEMVIPNA